MTSIALQAHAESDAVAVDANDTTGNVVPYTTAVNIEQRFNALREAAAVVTAARGSDAKAAAIADLANWLLNTAS